MLRRSGPVYKSVSLKACHRDRSPGHTLRICVQAAAIGGVGRPGDIGTDYTIVCESVCPAGQPSFRTIR